MDNSLRSALAAACSVDGTVSVNSELQDAVSQSAFSCSVCCTQVAGESEDNFNIILVVNVFLDVLILGSGD